MPGIKRHYVSKFMGNEWVLDSGYELNYAIYLDILYERGEILGWVKNRTPFKYSKPIEYTVKNKKNVVKHYIPDFLIFHKTGKYEILEVKGWEEAYKNVVQKKQIAKDFSNLNYTYVSKTDLKALERRLIKQNKCLPFGWVKIR